ncbi:hypothetical protein AHAS_Ahas15G0163100 [Arachis hypogaea]
MDVSVQRMGSKLYFTEGWLDLLTYYDQPNGMWAKFKFYLLHVFYVCSKIFEVEHIMRLNFLNLSSVLVNLCQTRRCNFNDWGINISLVSRCDNSIPYHIAWIADDEAYLTRGWSEFARILNVLTYDSVSVGCRYENDSTLYVSKD